MPELLYSGKFGKGELRVYRKRKDGRWLLDIRLYQLDPESGKMVPTEQGLTFPEEFFTPFLDSMKKLQEVYEQVGFHERQATPHHVHAAVCPVCKTGVREVQPGIYRCECGETEVVLLPLREALDALFERVTRERLFEDYAPAG